MSYIFLNCSLLISYVHVDIGPVFISQAWDCRIENFVSIQYGKVDLFYHTDNFHPCDITARFTSTLPSHRIENFVSIQYGKVDSSYHANFHLTSTPPSQWPSSFSLNPRTTMWLWNMLIIVSLQWFWSPTTGWATTWAKAKPGYTILSKGLAMTDMHLIQSMFFQSDAARPFLNGGEIWKLGSRRVQFGSKCSMLKWASRVRLSTAITDLCIVNLYLESCSFLDNPIAIYLCTQQ